MKVSWQKNQGFLDSLETPVVSTTEDIRKDWCNEALERKIFSKREMFDAYQMPEDESRAVVVLAKVIERAWSDLSAIGVLEEF